MLDVEIMAKSDAWDTLDPDPDWAKPVNNAIHGDYFKMFDVDYTVYNTLATKDQLDNIVAALGPTNVASVNTWFFETGFDNIDNYSETPEVTYENPYITKPDDVVAVMQPHIEHDEDGNVVSSEPATFENPNLGHLFYGQSNRVIAGEFNPEEFSEGFL